MSQSSTRPFEGLTPDTIADAVESLGLFCDGRLLALNSYENRVWQVGIEDKQPVIVKFYRPQRWSDEAILEEHQFAIELAEAGLSVVAPLLIRGASLHTFGGFRFAVFPRRGGHAPEAAHRPTLEALGRQLGRFHAVGAAGQFQHRPALSVETLGETAMAYLLAERWIPAHLEAAFESLCDNLLGHIRQIWTLTDGLPWIRLHGDCHPGNLLWRDDQAHFVDLDDCLSGPAIQDLWMLISGDRHEREQQWQWLLEGYRLFSPFEPRSLSLVEPLRTLRMLNYQAWLAKRWDDPAFPAAFPWFESSRHWEQVIQQLREQMDELQQGPLTLHD